MALKGPLQKEMSAIRILLSPVPAILHA
jgi:hypothetical protein